MFQYVILGQLHTNRMQAASHLRCARIAGAKVKPSVYLYDPWPECRGAYRNPK